MSVAHLPDLKDVRGPSRLPPPPLLPFSVSPAFTCVVLLYLICVAQFRGLGKARPPKVEETKDTAPRHEGNGNDSSSQKG